MPHSKLPKPTVYTASAPVEGSTLHKLLSPPETHKNTPRNNEQNSWQVEAMEYFNDRLRAIEARAVDIINTLHSIEESIDTIHKKIDRIEEARKE